MDRKSAARRFKTGRQRLGERWQSAGEIMLVFRYEVLNSGDAGKPESEERDEDYGTVVERKVVRVEGRVQTSPCDCRGGGEEGLKGDWWWSVVLRNRGTTRVLLY
jgi:hypothetical protein